MKMVKDTQPKDLDNKRLRYIFRRVISRINEKPNGFFQFRKMRGVRGLWYYGDSIEIDHRKEIVPTAIHEVLHDLYVNKNENWIRQVESKISQILTPKDVVTLITSVFSKVKLKEDEKE